MLYFVSVFQSSFFMAQNIPLYGIECMLFMQLAMVGCSKLCLFCGYYQQCFYLWAQLIFSFLLGIHLGAELLAHMQTVFEELSICFPR